MQNAEKLQNVIGDDLFPQMEHISDVKQVIEQMRDHAQEEQEWQTRGQILLNSLGENKYLYPDKNPYEHLLGFLTKAKIRVADPDYYIKTIEALIPKPPKPVIMAEKEGKKK